MTVPNVSINGWNAMSGSSNTREDRDPNPSDATSNADISTRSTRGGVVKRNGFWSHFGAESGAL